MMKKSVVARIQLESPENAHGSLFAVVSPITPLCLWALVCSWSKMIAAILLGTGGWLRWCVCLHRTCFLDAFLDHVIYGLLWDGFVLRSTSRKKQMTDSEFCIKYSIWGGGLFCIISASGWDWGPSCVRWELLSVPPSVTIQMVPISYWVEKCQLLVSTRKIRWSALWHQKISHQ